MPTATADRSHTYRDHYHSELKQGMFEQFRPEGIEYAKTPGSSVIIGQAFMRRRDGGVVTAAGEHVYLLPSCLYTDEWIDRQIVKQETVDVDSRLDSYLITTAADATGTFGFDRLSGGAYWILTKVKWRTLSAWAEQGGNLIQRVILENNQVLRVVLTR